MGFKFAALMEGIRPNTIPISMENATEIRIAGTLIPTLVSDILEMACAIIIPVNTPMIPVSYTHLTKLQYPPYIPKYYIRNGD